MNRHKNPEDGSTRSYGTNDRCLGVQEQAVLVALYNAPGSSWSDIAQYIVQNLRPLTKKSGVQVSLTRLVDKGLADRRARAQSTHVYRITPAGIKELKRTIVNTQGVWDGLPPDFLATSP